MAIQMATYDDSQMESGKFYSLHLTKEGHNALVEIASSNDTYKITFEDSRYLEIPYSTQYPPRIEVYETIFDQGGVSKCNLITVAQSIREEGLNKMVILESSKAITGFVIIRI